MQQTPLNLELATLRQQSIVADYGLGFQKYTLDNQIYDKILNHYIIHSKHFYAEDKNMYLQSIYQHSHPSLVYVDPIFNANLTKILKPAHEHWSGMPLLESYGYGIRVYQKGAYLFNHVDRIESHIISSTICIDHRLNRSWPFYIEDVHGNPHELSLQSGEGIFYESARLKHGRPYPLAGDFYAAIFLHYRPIDWCMSPEAL